MKIGDDMENKERQDFESVFTAKNGWDLTCINGCYQNIGTFKAFAGWKAAKDHATPEGFVLVPREPTQDMMIAALAVISTGIGKDHIDVEIIQCWKKMIEAQEQSHD